MSQPPAAPSKGLTWQLGLLLACSLSCWTRPLHANPIVPASDGTGTVVLPNGHRFDIQGGTLSADGANLFHSFQQFGLDAGQIANFLAAPSVRNVLGRVVGGDPSIINGLLQLSGSNANLYLMNPAGIVFGPQASLNVPGDFFATTATAIGFENDAWFEAFGSNDYATLIGTPSQFAFDAEAVGAIINAGNLSVNPGQHLALIGGQVANTGHLSAPGGQITASAVPGTSLIRIEQPGHLLSLEIEAPRSTDGRLLPIAPQDLPALLTGSGLDTGLVAGPDNTLEFSASGDRLPLAEATAAIAGRLDVSNSQGAAGELAVLGDRVALLDADLDASGTTGGNIRIGGDYRGEGDLPNARRTYVSRNATLRADALEAGHGGRVILWADEVTGFYGDISARGGSLGGDGGFVEVSGQETLDFAGSVDVGAPFGLDGTVLLDPDTIIIQAAGADDNQLNPNTPPGQPAGLILAGDGAPVTMTLSTAVLGAITGSVELHATSEIRINNAITFQSTNVNFFAPRIVINAPVSFSSSTSSLGLIAAHDVLVNAPIAAGFQNFRAGNEVEVNAPLSGQAINLSSSNLADINPGGTISATNVSLSANNLVGINSSVTGTSSVQIRSNGFSTGGSAAISGNGLLSIAPITANYNINIGGLSGMPGQLDLQDSELAAIQPGFSSVVIGRADGTGTIRVHNLTSLNSPVTIQGASHLIGPDLGTNWMLTGTGQGSLTAGSRTANFNNITNITSGAGNDTLALQNGVNFGGWVDGGAGYDTLDYSQYGGPAQVNLANNTATGLVNAFNFEATDMATANAIATQTSPNNPANTPSSLPQLTLIPPVLSVSQPLLPTTNDDAVLALGDRAAVDRAFDEGDAWAASAALDNLFSDAFAKRLGRRVAPLSVADFQRRLEELAAETGTRPAMIYVYPRAAQLELILVPFVGEPIHYSVPDAPAERVFASARKLFDEIVDPTRRRTTAYLPPAQQLDTWIMQPLLADLERLNIDTLLFSLDEGLRSLPLAVLHDGERFLIERYRFSVIPSLTLANLNYTDVRGAGILAMGISEFQHLSPLPAVPAEIAAIANTSLHGKAVLNEGFTVENLKQQRQQARAAVVHLATHAEFVPGDRGYSFIQFWERPLAFEQLAQLDWRDPDLALLVLSACRTALGDPDAEYGFAGLAVQAGVDTAVASLWYVSDVATLGLMSEFYRQLRIAPFKSEALRRAQLALLHGDLQLEAQQLTGSDARLPLPPALGDLGDRHFRHPYYWSGFTAIGNPW